MTGHTRPAKTCADGAAGGCLEGCEAVRERRSRAVFLFLCREERTIKNDGRTFLDLAEDVTPPAYQVIRINAMKKHNIHIPSDKISAYCRQNQIRQLMLFGSVLQDDFKPESDIDVLVTFEQEAQIGFMALGRMQRELSELFRRPVDLVPKDGLKPRIRDSVLSTAEVIYAA